ncbi:MULTISPECIES: hypothetical protein [Acetobacteraceae]|uniref:hypothetical protein n=1 Tax=Acetobacteraceae TaxID=433 RepID=UPI002011747E|nr:MULTISPECIES: hypothetical protein [unclassified Parasaccharibacter]
MFPICLGVISSPEWYPLPEISNNPRLLIFTCLKSEKEEFTEKSGYTTEYDEFEPEETYLVFDDGKPAISKFPSPLIEPEK